jgi:acetolactate synthase-1/2/3 large subunit
MHIHQALTRSSKIHTYLPRHEQGGGFSAEGYARATGKAEVVMATSVLGATNLVTSIADAYLDFIPMVAITGKAPRHMIGKGAFQETDVFSVTAQVVKHNYLVMDANDLQSIGYRSSYRPPPRCGSRTQTPHPIQSHGDRRGQPVGAQIDARIVPA